MTWVYGIKNFPANILVNKIMHTVMYNNKWIIVYVRDSIF